MKKMYSFRKIKLGLVSVAVGLAFLGTAQAAADTTDSIRPSEISLQEKDFEAEVEKAIDEGPLKDLGAEIAAKLAEPVVAEENAQPGDLLSREFTEGEWKESASEGVDKVVYTLSNTMSLKSTRLVDNDQEEGVLAPVIEEKRSETPFETNDYKGLIRQILKKTTEKEIVKTVEAEDKQSTADIVFVIDHSVSMDSSIDAVKKYVATFVRNLADQHIVARLSLVDYAAANDINYTDFAGSYFTTDSDLFVTALGKIKTKGGSEALTVPLDKIAKDKDFDWKEDSERFVIIVTDEDADVMGDAPTMAMVTAELKAADIRTSVISERGLASYYHDLVEQTGGIFTDITADFSKVLLEDLSSWVVESTKTVITHEIVTETYEFVLEMEFVSKVKELPNPPSTVIENPKEEVVLRDQELHKTSQETTGQDGQNSPKSLQEKGSQESHKVLPKTGSQGGVLSMLGVALLAFASLLVGLKRKKD